MTNVPTFEIFLQYIFCEIFPVLEFDLKMACAQFQGNRFRTDSDGATDLPK